MLGREKLAEKFEQQITKKEDPGTYQFDTNLFNMIGQ